MDARDCADAPEVLMAASLKPTAGNLLFGKIPNFGSLNRAQRLANEHYAKMQMLFRVIQALT